MSCNGPRRALHMQTYAITADLMRDFERERISR